MSINRVAVIGAGVMGSQICQVLATNGFRVVLRDINDEQLETGMNRITDGPFGLKKAVDRGLMSVAEMEETLGRISTTLDLATACEGVDMAIEVVPEDIGLKIDIFKQLDEVAPPDTILASNTAGLPITALAHATNRKEKVIGWHWFQPCSVMKLAEIVVHPGTSDETVLAITEAAEKAKKIPVVVKDQPLVWGFVGNRINRAVRKEAAAIVAEGIASEEDVDAIMKHGFRWPMGPFEMQGSRTMK